MALALVCVPIYLCMYKYIHTVIYIIVYIKTATILYPSPIPVTFSIPLVCMHIDRETRLAVQFGDYADYMRISLYI